MINISPKISIITPVYNSEKYISKCINSILDQTFSNFELIIIDDGSNDQSLLVCQKYSEIDSRIKVYHKTNGGVSSARNYGIEKADGEWIAFIDSDDWVEPSYLEDFGLTNETTEDTLLLQGMKDCYNGIISKNIKRCYTINHNCSNIKRATEQLELLHSGYPVCKLYNRAIIVRQKIKFDINISSYEDSLFNFDYFKYVRVVITSTKSGYIYVHHNNESLSRRKIPFEEREKILEKFHKKTIYLINLYTLSSKYSAKVYNLSLSLLFQAIYSLYTPKFKICKEERIKCLNILQSKYNDLFHIYKSNSFSYLIIHTKSIYIIDIYYSLLFKSKNTFPSLYNKYRWLKSKL